MATEILTCLFKGWMDCTITAVLETSNIRVVFKKIIFLARMKIFACYLALKKSGTLKSFDAVSSSKIFSLFLAALKSKSL